MGGLVPEPGREPLRHLAADSLPPNPPRRIGVGQRARARRFPIFNSSSFPISKFLSFQRHVSPFPAFQLSRFSAALSSFPISRFLGFPQALSQFLDFPLSRFSAFPHPPPYPFALRRPAPP
jgi:hypothetical protein